MTETSGSKSPRVRFGPFDADLQTQELRKHGVRLRLPGQSFRVLRMLLERPDGLVTREEFRQALWPSDTFVDFDHGLSAAVNRLREALGDSADHPQFIETLPRRGYRFVGAVDKPIFRSRTEPKGRFKESTAKTWWTSAGATFLIVLCGLGIWRYTRARSDGVARAMEIVPLVGLDGALSWPAFSPDGNQVVFALRDEKRSGIYSTLVSGGKPLRLTNGSNDDYPRWSPDGREIAFTRPSEQGVAIYTIPALGGFERRLYSGPATEFPKAFDWSPDNEYLAISQAESDKTHARIALLSLADSRTRPITEPAELMLDMEPAFSPDGSTVAFVMSNVGGMVSELYVVPVSGGEAKRLTFDKRTIFPSPAWTPNGNEILFSSSRSGSPRLWRISAAGGNPEPVAGGSMNAMGPTVSSRGNQLAYQEVLRQTDISRVDLMSKNLQPSQPVVVIGAKGRNFRPQFSPDGTRIAFESSQSGYNEIWVCDSDGSNCGSLTSLKGAAGAPRWSPDARYIAFEYRPHGYSEIYVTEVGEGQPRLVATFPGGDNGGPSWSRDGQWLYFYSDREHGRFQIFKIPLGGGPPIQVTKNGGIFGVESQDSRFFYFAKWEEPGIWRMPLTGGGDEIRILDQPGGRTQWGDWAIVDNGIYFFARRPEFKDSIQFFDFASRQTISILVLERSPRRYHDLAISPDKKSILFAQEKLSESRIVLVKNFR